ncbi:MAG: hypothetical protein JNM29_01620 [Candidatus Odyssella sp.]|nr:hypothetical protein [Candidatus Odyssella sp.]
MVRLGGILAFVLIAVVIIGAFLAQNKAVAIVFGLIQTAIMIFVFWSSKGLFNSRNYRTADIAIMGIIVILVVLWIFSLLGGAGVGAVANPQALASALGVIGIISLIVLLAWLVFFIWFSIGAMGFANVGGGGLWKAIGILYIVGLGLLILTVVVGIIAAMAQSQGMVGLMAITGLIGALVLLAAWICHGIGLITGAGKMGA